MDVQIEYHDDEPHGRLNASNDFSRAAWNRICALVLGAQPDAKIIGNDIRLEWSTVLTIAGDISRLRNEFYFIASYNDAAKGHLQRYRKEVLAIRGAADHFILQIEESEIQGELEERGFTKRTLTPAQLRDTAIMISLRNGANFSVPGTGKTTVALATHLLTKNDGMHLLIVAPKNAFGAWDEVIEDCMDPAIAGEWDIERLTGGYESIRQALKNPPRRMMISFDQLTRVRDLIARFLALHPTHLILDESHRMKAGGRSLRGGALLRLAHLPIRRDILSGTPIPRSIEDIGPQLDFLWPGQGLGWQAVDAARPNEVLRDLYVRTTKSELGLPDIDRHFIPVRMSAPQMALYSVIRQEVLKRLSGIRATSNVDLMSAKRLVMRLLQASSNPILVVKRLTEETPETYRYDDPKIEAIFRGIVEEMDSPKITTACSLARDLARDGHRSVIWTSFTENVERIAALLKDLGATYIHGGVDTGEADDPSTREGRIRLFHNEGSGCRVLVANPAACSEGISLHKACHHAIYVDRSYNAAHYLQSVDRIHRLGLPPDTETHVYILESVAPNTIGAIDYSVRRRMIQKLRTMSEALDDFDLRRLALDEEEGDAPLDYDITLEDLSDIIEELSGTAAAPGEDEAL